MRSVKTVLIFMVIVLAGALLAAGTTYADSRGRGGGSQYRGGGQYYGGGRDYRGGGQYYGGWRGHRGGGHGHYYGGRHYYGWGRYYRGWPYYRGWGYPYYGGWGYPYYYPYFSLGYYPYYYPYSYPYDTPYAPTGVAPSSPPVYIERGQEDPGPAETPSGVWYYCPDSQGYYPYVKECPGGWQTVPAEPPAEKGR